MVVSGTHPICWSLLNDAPNAPYATRALRDSRALRAQRALCAIRALRAFDIEKRAPRAHRALLKCDITLILN